MALSVKQDSDRDRLVWWRPDTETFRGAATTVLIAWTLALLVQVIGLVAQLSTFLDPSFALGSFGQPPLFEVILRLIEQMVFEGVVLRSLLYVPIILALWLFLPIVRESALSVVLRRAALGAALALPGAVALGLIQGLTYPPSNPVLGLWLNHLVWSPLQMLVGLVVFVAFAAVLVWLRAWARANGDVEQNEE